MALTSIHITGPLRVLDAAGTPVPGLSRRGQAMIAYLACQSGLRAERAALADLLWSDRGEEQARASLRQELSVLRRALPEGVLEADRQTIWLVPEGVSVHRGEPGELLQGFDLPSEGFEDWLRAERSTHGIHTRSQSRSDSERPVLAVLPFDELGAPDSDMFADGVVEEITGALSRVDEFDVIARQSAFALRDKGLDVPTSAERLGADYLVEGSVRRVGERVRIAVQLVRGADAQTVWSDRFDDRIDDLFDLQDRIAAQVAGHLSPNLRAAEIARAGRAAPGDRSAYELKLTALPHFWAHRKEANARAIELFDLAIRRAPDYAPAIAFKAWALAQQPSYMWSSDPRGDHAAAQELAERAALLAGNHAPTLVALSAAFALSGNDAERARDYARRALEIDPSNAWGWMRLGWSEHFLAKHECAIAHFERAEDLSPLDPFRFNFLFGKSAASRSLGDYDRALSLAHEGLRASPGTTWAYRMLVGTLVMAGRLDEAKEAAKTLKAHYPHLTMRYLADCFPQAAKAVMPDYYSSFDQMLRDLEVPET